MPYFIFIVIITVLNDYFIGLAIEKDSKRKKLYLIQSLVLNIIILISFKYISPSIIDFQKIGNLIGWNYSMSVLEIAIPIGLSFYIFKSLSYVIEVYRNNQKAEKNILTYSLYVLFFPEILAGPIDRPGNLLPQLKKFHHFDYNNTTEGLKLFAWGLFKKVVIADRLALFVNHTYNNIENYSGLPLILSVIFYSVQIYCDFSGYSDMAIGTGKFLGFDLKINFNRPYLSESISEFWRRWHISLSTWFRDYVFLPIAFSTARLTNNLKLKSIIKDKINYSIATLITMLLIGLWHGMNISFITWSLIIASYLIISAFTKKIRRNISKLFKKFIPGNVLVIAKVIFIFCLITLAWIFFRTNNISNAIIIISKLFESSKGGYLFGLSHFQVLLGMFFSFTLFIVEYFSDSYNPFTKLTPKVALFRWGFYYFLILSIFVFGEFGKTSFIYFKF